MEIAQVMYSLSHPKLRGSEHTSHKTESVSQERLNFVLGITMQVDDLSRVTHFLGTQMKQRWARCCLP